MTDSPLSGRGVWLLAPALLFSPIAPTQTQSPQGMLWHAVTQPPAAVVAWDAAERARSDAWTSSSFVTANTAELLALPESGGAVELGFELTGIGLVAARFERFERTLGHAVFRGFLTRGGSVDDTVLVAVGPTGAVAASFQLGEAVFSLYSSGVETAGGRLVHVLRGVDGALLHDCGTSHEHAVSAPGGPARTGHGQGGSSAAGQADTVFDVLAVYTPRARSTGGGTAALESQLVLRVSETTLASDLSGAPVRFRLVHMHETAYVEDGTGNDLSRFRSTSDGFMDEVHALRNDYGADLMHLVTQPPSLSYCGVAYLMNRNSTGFATSAFGVTVRSCLGGFTMSHEMGHNISCHHDRANAGGSLYPYGYGFRTADNSFRTIMSYSPGTRVLRWSSPSVQYNGYTLGAANSEDNARAISNVRATVQNFRASVVYDWVRIEAGVGGFLGEPYLGGSGRSTGNGPVELLLSLAPQGAPGVLFVGASRLDQPLLGATLVPNPFVGLPVTGSLAPVTMDVSVLRTLPAGVDVYLQAFFTDAAGPQGVSASDALQVTTL